MDGRRVFCIVGVYTVDIRGKRTRVFLYTGKRGLYRFDVDFIE